MEKGMKHKAIAAKVALHPEGVDRNYSYNFASADENLSPSTRRAWIEI